MPKIKKIINASQCSKASIVSLNALPIKNPIAAIMSWNSVNQKAQIMPVFAEFSLDFTPIHKEIAKESIVSPKHITIISIKDIIVIL